MRGFSTTALHNFEEKRQNPPHILPIYPTSSFTFETLEESIEIFTKQKKGHVYSRYGNPTIQTVEEQLAGLEGHGDDSPYFALLTSSGMSAIHVLLSSLLKSGDTLLTQKRLYGGTTELFEKVLSRQGIKTVYLNEINKKSLDEAYQTHENLKAIYIETPSNPTLSCISFTEVANFAREKSIYSIVDNTFCTPYIQQPILLGIDFCIYSTTKFLNGHGNSIAGAITGRVNPEIQLAIWTQLKLNGATCNAFDAWLLHQGLKTLEIRMDRHCQNAQILSNYLRNHSAVLRVYYPGAIDHITHTIACSQMQNGFGGMLSFEIKGGLEQVKKVINQLQVATYAPTLGDVDTLVMHPATSSHLNIKEEDRIKEGVTDGLIRVSVGIENIEDIIADFEQALASL